MQKEKYNPNKTLNKALKRVAEKSYLYRWEAYRRENCLSGQVVFAFSSSAQGLSDDQIAKAMEFAMGRYNVYIVMVHACFVAPDGEYYEESRDAETCPVRLGYDDSEKVNAHNAKVERKQKAGIQGGDKFHHSTEDVEGLIADMIDDASTSGNRAHYIDSVVVLRLKTDKFARMADDDGWCKRQTLHRREKLLAKRLEEVA